MDAQLFNRVGLILCFLGGFLIAPELIGLKRIKILEGSIEKILFKAQVWLDYYLSDLRGVDKFLLGLKIKLSSNEFKALVNTSIAIIYFVGIWLIKLSFNLTSATWLRVLSIGFVLAWGISGLVAILVHYHYPRNRLSDDLDLGSEIFLAPFWILIHTISVALILAFALAIIVYLSFFLIIYGVATLSLRALVGNDMLQSVFVWMGIIFLIIGSALQFIATF